MKAIPVKWIEDQLEVLKKDNPRVGRRYWVVQVECLESLLRNAPTVEVQERN